MFYFQHLEVNSRESKGCSGGQMKIFLIKNWANFTLLGKIGKLLTRIYKKVSTYNFLGYEPNRSKS